MFLQGIVGGREQRASVELIDRWNEPGDLKRFQEGGVVGILVKDVHDRSAH